MITNTLARPVAVLIALGVSLSAHATLRSWLGTDMFNPTRWTVANNWLSGAPVAGDDLVFPAGASHPNNNNDFPVSTTFNSIAIGGNNYTLGGNSIALNAGILVTNSGNMVMVNNSLRLNSNQTFTVNASSSGLSLLGPIDTNGKVLTVAVTSPAVMQVSLEISGAGGLIKTGSGSLIVSNNSYAGTTIISNGTMRVLGSQPGSPVTLYGGTLGGNGTVGTLTASGPGAKILDPGTSPGILTSSNVLLDANTTLAIQLNGPTPGPGYDQLNVAGSVNLGGASLGLSLGFIPTAVNTFIIVNNDGSDPVVGTFSGLPEGTTFTNSGVPFRITYAGGDGNDVVLNLAGVPRTWSGAGVNSLWTNPANWDGGVAPSAGDDLIFPASPIQIGGLNNYPSGTVFNSITIAGGFYQLSGSNIFLRGGINASNTAFQNSIDLPLTLLADQSITSGNANVNLYLYGTIDTNGKNLTFAGKGTFQINSLIGGSGGFTKTGTGTLSMYTSNSFSGAVQILQGSLTMYQGDVLGNSNGGTTVSSNATLNLLSSITVAEPLVLNGPVTVFNGTNTLTGPVTLAASNITLQIGGGASLIVNAPISGAGSLTKSSFGSLILNSNNTYAGGTILTGGILGGNGRIGTITASGTALQTIAPGASPGILNCSNLNLNIYTTCAFELNGPTPGSGYDQLDISGSVALNNATLLFSLGYTPTLGDSFVIINNDGADAITGNFSGLPSGSLITNGAAIFRIAYNGGDGNDVTLTTTLGAPPSTLTAITSLPSQFKQLTGQGLSNLTYTVQAATNLASPIAWTKLGTASANSSGVYQFMDTNGPSFPRRFYRAISP